MAACHQNRSIPNQKRGFLPPKHRGKQDCHFGHPTPLHKCHSTHHKPKKWEVIVRKASKKSQPTFRLSTRELLSLKRRRFQVPIVFLSKHVGMGTIARRQMSHLWYENDTLRKFHNHDSVFLFNPRAHSVHDGVRPLVMSVRFCERSRAQAIECHLHHG